MGKKRKLQSLKSNLAREGNIEETPSTSEMVALEKNADIKSSVPSESVEHTTRRKRRLHTYERALLMYEKIQAERREQAKKRRLEREQRKEALEQYMCIKKKMDKALMKRNRRGQPNLNAQMKVLLEKIEKKVAK